MMLAGRGAKSACASRNVPGATAWLSRRSSPTVRPRRPASKPSDVIVEFDGEHVRSARQFGRLVQETPPGRTGQGDHHPRWSEGRTCRLRRPKGEGPASSGMATASAAGSAIWTTCASLAGSAIACRRSISTTISIFHGALSGRRLGVSVDELTDQLAEYFGAKHGVLVTSVTDGSAASRGGFEGRRRHHRRSTAAAGAIARGPRPRAPRRRRRRDHDRDRARQEGKQVKAKIEARAAPDLRCAARPA